jgi:hypothetical protein
MPLLSTDADATYEIDGRTGNMRFVSAARNPLQYYCDKMFLICGNNYQLLVERVRGSGFSVGGILTIQTP